MSEDKPEYITEAEEMLGVGYEPAATIESPRTVRELTTTGLREYKAWGWVKVSAKFIAHIKILKGAKLSIWQTITLSIDETGHCGLSVAELVDLTGYSRSEVIESLQELDEMGYLSINRTSGKKSIYTPEFAARGGGVPTTEPDPSRKTTSPVPLLGSASDQSSPSEENSVPSSNRVKRVKGDAVDLELLKLQKTQPLEEGLKAFERDMQCPASWSWYPAKSSDESAWKALREFVVEVYRADPKAFEKYYTWARQPFSKGSMTVLGIKRSPADFELSWAAYVAANGLYDPKPQETHDTPLEDWRKEIKL